MTQKPDREKIAERIGAIDSPLIRNKELANVPREISQYVHYRVRHILEERMRS